MKLPFVKKVAKSFTQTASEQAKKEVKKTAIDMLPSVLTLGGMILSIFVFKKARSEESIAQSPQRPYSSTRITTNNYFLGEVSDDVIKKILEDK